jgi:hypothetical protein
MPSTLNDSKPYVCIPNTDLNSLKMHALDPLNSMAKGKLIPNALYNKCL